ncbi:MAG: NADH-quinone oxidoreductase subunit NuoK [bacterium]
MIAAGQLIFSVAIFLFCFGALTFFTKRSAVVALMGIELMLNGVNLVLVQAGQIYKNAEGTSLVLFVTLVAAAEAALALSIFVILYRKYGTLTLENFRSLKG